MTFEELWEFSDTIPGSFTTLNGQKLHEYAMQVPPRAQIVEVGVDQGRSASVLLASARDTGAFVWLVDSWTGILIDNYYKVKKLRGRFPWVECAILRTTSVVEAAKMLDEAIDLIHIDAHHGDGNGVCDPDSGPYIDCKSWLPKLKSGGVACFHDYNSSFRARVLIYRRMGRSRRVGRTGDDVNLISSYRQYARYLAWAKRRICVDGQRGASGSRTAIRETLSMLEGERHRGSTMKVLVIEPPNQLLPGDTAHPNGSLGPAYLVAALRAEGIEADYYDGTVGDDGEVFSRRIVQGNGLTRYGALPRELMSVIEHYDIVATSSIFTAQTRMHFEIADIVRTLSPRPLLISGGVNARALRKHFIAAGFDIVCSGEEDSLLSIILSKHRPAKDLNDLPLPALDAMPLDIYQRIGIPHAGILPPGTRFASIQTSRGCQDRCTFCHISTEKRDGSGFLRTFSIEYIRRYVDYALSLGIQRLYFEDDNLFFSKRRLYALAPVLKRGGLDYSNVNGGNLRFLFEKGEVDTEFIAMLADFGLRELVLPFESRSVAMMEKYATGKYDPDVLDSAALVKALKAAGIRIAGNFMIGFPDEDWDSVLRTKDFARELLDAGLDAVGFMIPVPYPGSLDFERLDHTEFDKDVLSFTDRMHWRAKPLFPTLVDGDRLAAAAQEFWEELNPREYIDSKRLQNVGKV